MIDLQSSVPFPETAGIILCGGKSSRMGRPKWSLPLGDENCLLRTIRILSEIVAPIVVVAAEDQYITGLPTGVILVRDDIPEKGPLAGLSAGFEALKSQPQIHSAYVTACDVPLLKPEFVTTIISQLESFELAVVKEEEFYHPLAAVYRVNLADRVRSLLAADRLRPLYLIEESHSRDIDVNALRHVDPNLESLRNMNTPADYRDVLQHLGLPVPE
jgi:molybdopterin-guanine dinucleotide biosynthesis protein A